VKNLGPLRGLPLRFLGLRQTLVRDLSPLAGMRLEELDLSGSSVTDLMPLRGQPITVIDLDLDLPRHRDVLRSLPRLQLINRRPAVQVLRKA
jgi:hypothetical protein